MTSQSSNLCNHNANKNSSRQCAQHYAHSITRTAPRAQHHVSRLKSHECGDLTRTELPVSLIKDLGTTFCVRIHLRNIQPAIPAIGGVIWSYSTVCIYQPRPIRQQCWRSVSCKNKHSGHLLANPGRRQDRSSFSALSLLHTFCLMRALVVFFIVSACGFLQCHGRQTSATTVPLSA